MYSGLYTHSIDNKGRTVIPSKFRTKLGERFYITKGMHGCLWVFSDDEWRDFQKTMSPKTYLDSRGIKLERFFVGSAVECVPDAQGRITLPQNLRDHSGIELETDICVIGLADKVEIWNTDRWIAFNATLTDDVIEALGSTDDDIAASLT